MARLLFARSSSARRNGPSARWAMAMRASRARRIWEDQLPLLRDKKLHPVWRERAEIEQNLEKREKL